MFSGALCSPTVWAIRLSSSAESGSGLPPSALVVALGRLVAGLDEDSSPLARERQREIERRDRVTAG